MTTNETKQENKIRRRSSSENDLNFLYLTHYQEDADKLSSGNSRYCSENDLKQLEKERHVSSCDDELVLEHVLEDEIEQELEAHARRESVPLVENEHIVEQVKHEMIKRKLSGNLLKLGLGKNKQAGEKKEWTESMSKMVNSLYKAESGESDKLCHESPTVNGKSRESSSDRSKSGSSGSMNDTDFVNAESNGLENQEEDDFEAELEARARKESLVNTDIEQKALQFLEDSMAEQDARNLNSTGKTVDTIHDGDVIKIYLDAVVDQINEERLEKIARRNSLLGIDDEHFDDSYLSSSPSLSVTPVLSPTSPNPNKDVDLMVSVGKTINHVEDKTEDEKHKRTALGMSLDSTDDIEMIVNNCPLGSVMENEQREDEDFVEDVDAYEARTRRKSSVIEDISILCSDCKAMKQKCKECAKLLKSQELLRINERRLSRTESADSGLVGSLASEKKYVTKKAGKLNGIRDMSQEGKEDLSSQKHGNNEYASQKVMCNTDKVFVNGECTADLERNYDVKGHNAHHDNFSDDESTDGVHDENRTVKVFPSGKSDKRDFTRQEKVGYWLHSLSQTKKMENDGVKSRIQGYDTIRKPEEEKGHGYNHSLKEKGKSDQDGGVKAGFNNTKSLKSSFGEEDVFYSPDDLPKRGKISPERPGTLNLKQRAGAGFKKGVSQPQVKVSGRSAPGGSESGLSLRRQSSTEIHVNKNDPGRFLMFKLVIHISRQQD